MIPTWTNKRRGRKYIGKRLDRALVKDNLIDRWGNPRTSVLVSDVSDHMPISISWNAWRIMRGVPFKFNRAWLDDAEYTNMVKTIWNEDVNIDDNQVVDSFHNRLQRVKAATKKWEIRKKYALKIELVHIK